jgi:hypothetical protein
MSILIKGLISACLSRPHDAAVQSDLRGFAIHLISNQSNRHRTGMNPNLTGWSLHHAPNDFHPASRWLIVLEFLDSASGSKKSGAHLEIYDSLVATLLWRAKSVLYSWIDKTWTPRSGIFGDSEPRINICAYLIIVLNVRPHMWCPSWTEPLIVMPIMPQGVIYWSVSPPTWCNNQRSR